MLTKCERKFSLLSGAPRVLATAPEIRRVVSVRSCRLLQQTSFDGKRVYPDWFHGHVVVSPINVMTRDLKRRTGFYRQCVYEKYSNTFSPPTRMVHFFYDAENIVRMFIVCVTSGRGDKQRLKKPYV